MKLFRHEGNFRPLGICWLLGMFVLFIPCTLALCLLAPSVAYADSEVILTMPPSDGTNSPGETAVDGIAPFDTDSGEATSSVENPVLSEDSPKDSPKIVSSESAVTEPAAIKRPSKSKGKTVTAKKVTSAKASKLTPKSVLRLLAANNAKVIGEDAKVDDLPVLSTDDDRFPAATILFSDGASLPTEIFGMDEGDIYQVPLRAGVCTAEEMDDFEYGIANLRTPIAVILTDYPNPDVQYMVDNYDELKKYAEKELGTAQKNHPETFTNKKPVDDDVLLYTLIGPAVARAKGANPDMSTEDIVTVVSEAIAWQSVETILSDSDAACELIRNNELKVVAAMVDNVSGRVHWLGEHPLQKEFLKEIPKEVKTKREKSTVIDESEVTEPLSEEQIDKYIEESSVVGGGFNCCQYTAPCYVTAQAYLPCYRLFYPYCWYFRPWYGCGVPLFVPYPYFDPWYYGYGPYVPCWDRAWCGFCIGYAIGFDVGLHVARNFHPCCRRWDRPCYRHPWCHPGWHPGDCHDKICRGPHHGPGPGPGHPGGPGGYGRPGGPKHHPGPGGHGPGPGHDSHGSGPGHDAPGSEKKSGVTSAQDTNRDSNGRYVPGGYRPDGKGGGNFGPGNRPGGVRGDSKAGGSRDSVPSRPGVSTRSGSDTTRRPSSGGSRGKVGTGDGVKEKPNRGNSGSGPGKGERSHPGSAAGGPRPRAGSDNAAGSPRPGGAPRPVDRGKSGAPRQARPGGPGRHASASTASTEGGGTTFRSPSGNSFQSSRLANGSGGGSPMSVGRPNSDRFASSPIPGNSGAGRSAGLRDSGYPRGSGRSGRSVGSMDGSPRSVGSSPRGMNPMGPTGGGHSMGAMTGNPRGHMGNSGGHMGSPGGHMGVPGGHMGGPGGHMGGPGGGHR